MNRPTFAQLRSSRFPKVLGFCTTDFNDILMAANECEERLFYDPMQPDEGWLFASPGMVFNVQPINPPNGFAYVTTPRNVARLIDIAICQTPIKIRNGFFEFMVFGSGLMPRASACGNGTFLTQNTACINATAAFERDNVPTLTDLSPVPQFIRCFPSNNGDLGKRMLIQGLDQNGIQVLGIDPLTGNAISGEFVNLQFPFVQTKNEFSKITGLLKEQTLGPVQIFQVDTITGNQAPLSSMETSETVANYRRYLLNGLPRNCCNTPAGSVQVSAKAKLDFVPLTTDSDYLNIPNIPALIEEGQSLRYSSIDNQISAGLEAKHHNKAIAILNGQMDHVEGKINTAITVPIFGSDRLRAQPR